MTRSFKTANISHDLLSMNAVNIEVLTNFDALGLAWISCISEQKSIYLFSSIEVSTVESLLAAERYDEIDTCCPPGSMNVLPSVKRERERERERERVTVCWVFQDPTRSVNPATQ